MSSSPRCTEEQQLQFTTTTTTTWHAWYRRYCCCDSSNNATTCNNDTANCHRRRTAAAAISYNDTDLFDILRDIRNSSDVRPPFVALEASMAPLRNNERRYVPFTTTNFLMFTLHNQRDRARIMAATDASYADYEFIDEFSSNYSNSENGGDNSTTAAINDFHDWLLTIAKRTTLHHDDVWERWHVLANSVARRSGGDSGECATTTETAANLSRVFDTLVKYYRKCLLCGIRRKEEEEENATEAAPSQHRYYYRPLYVSNPLTFRHSRWSWRVFDDDTFWYDVAPKLLFDLPHWRSHEHLCLGGGGGGGGKTTTAENNNDDDDEIIDYRRRGGDDAATSINCRWRENARSIVCNNALLVLTVISDRIVARYDRFTVSHWRQVERLFDECVKRRFYVPLVPLSLAVSRTRLSREIERIVAATPPIYAHDHYGVNSLAVDYVKASRALPANHYDGVQCACDYERSTSVASAHVIGGGDNSGVSIMTIRSARESCLAIASLNGRSLRYSTRLMSGDDAVTAAATPSLHDDALYAAVVTHGARFFATFVNMPEATREKMKFFLTNLLFGYIGLTLRLMFKSSTVGQQSAARGAATVLLNDRPVWFAYRRNVGAATVVDRHFVPTTADSFDSAWLDERTLRLLSNHMYNNRSDNGDATTI